MKTIKIKQLHILNFKGVREMHYDFDGNNAIINGANGTGKTTAFDAFTWVLFGKDSQGRDKFRIKTIDDMGYEISKIPHTVSVVLDVDGEETRLTRTYKEKWVKRRGDVDETFDGHEEERSWNDVPCTATEYKAKVAALCDEAQFRAITSPAYFTSLKPMVQREMLINMAGGITIADVAQGREDFSRLLMTMNGKTLEEYKKEISAKKNRIKADADTLPARIEQCATLRPAEQNWAEIERELALKKQAVADIDRQLADASNAVTMATNAQDDKKRELGKLAQDKLRIEEAIENEINRQFKEANRERVEAIEKIETFTQEIKRIKSHKQVYAGFVEADTKEMAECTSKREKLIAEWKAIKAETLTIDESNFVCPVCKRPLDPNEIAAKKEQMIANFNADKARRIADNTSRGKANNDRKNELAAKIEENTKLVDKDTESIRIMEEEILMLRTWLQNTPEPKKATAGPMLATNEAYLNLLQREQNLRHQLATDVLPTSDTADLTEGKAMLVEAIQDLTKQLADRTMIERCDQQRAELEARLRTELQQIAELEGIEYTIQEFSKQRIKSIEDKINAMFKVVRFKMFERQVNGQIVETCEAMVNNIPYSTLSNAQRINAGLDIINALCKRYDVCAPIFVDNSEAINNVLATEGQQIQLKVTADKKINYTTI